MYILKYLPSAETDILEIDVYLHENSPFAADKFADCIEKSTKALLSYPFMFPIYEDDPYFRHMTLPYNYRLFYHVDEEAGIIKIHRILHGTRNIKSVLANQ